MPEHTVDMIFCPEAKENVWLSEGRCAYCNQKLDVHVARHAGRIRTHWEGCVRHHPECASVRLLRVLGRLRAIAGEMAQHEGAEGWSAWMPEIITHCFKETDVLIKEMEGFWSDD